jgi:hypothetical protein
VTGSHDKEIEVAKANNDAGSVNITPKENDSPRIGRPPVVISEEVLNEICLRTSEGTSLRQLGRQKDMPSLHAIRKRLVEDSEFAKRYALAREGMYQTWAEEILEISDDGTTDYVTKVGRNGHEYEAVDQEHIQRSRLRVDSRKWLLSKLMPKQYGDRVEHEHGGEVQHTVDITALSEREKMRRFALFMLEDRAAGKGATIEGEAEQASTSPPVDQSAND